MPRQGMIRGEVDARSAGLDLENLEKALIASDCHASVKRAPLQASARMTEGPCMHSVLRPRSS